MFSKNTIQNNIENIQKNIDEVCEKTGRDSKNISLMGVTKGRTIDDIHSLIDAGITCIGENKVQEAERKLPLIQASVEKHFIGHLQSNKVNKVLSLCDCIHAVDTVRLAEIISNKAGILERVVPIFIEINTSGEPQKFGFMPEDVIAKFPLILGLKHITVRGLMTIAKQGTEKEISNCFRSLCSLRDTLVQTYTCPLLLSMGMTDDYILALEEGADILRIGRALFE